jgi:Neuraminidase (sialidase)
MFKKISGALAPQLSLRVSFLFMGILTLSQIICPITAKSQQAAFHTGVISSYRTTGFVTSAYPVINRLSNGRLVCIFACTDTVKSSKLKIAVCVSDDNGLTWSKPEIIFDHPKAIDADPNLLVDGDHIFAFSTTVPPISHRIDSTAIFVRVSDDGVNWSEERQIKQPHRYICGKIHQGHRLKDGTLIIGYSWDTWAEQHMPPATEGQMNLKSGVLRSKDGGKTWLPGGDIYADVRKTSPDATGGLAEPATVVLADGRILALLRAGGDKLYEAWSNDGGLSWETPRPSQLTAHNSPAALWKLDDSPDVLVTWDDSPTGRDPLTAALSTNGGKTWSKPRVIVRTGGPQASYPSAIQAKDGTMIIVWQQNVDKGREIRIARFNRAWLLGNK